MKQTSSKTGIPKVSKTSAAPPPDESLEDARVWLRAYHYDRIADTIDRVMSGWKQEGKLTRRNWWEILAGKPDGSPRVAGGITFPVLRTARLRQGLPDVPNAIQVNDHEEPPPIRVNPRWPKKKRAPKGRSTSRK